MRSGKVERLFLGVADPGFGIVFWRKHPNLWYANCRGRGVVSLSMTLITTSFLFMGLQNCLGTTFFQF
jgi:hypothetical protein